MGDPHSDILERIRKMQNNKPKRKEIRIKNYNYALSGYYFITICTKDRKNILSKIENKNDASTVGVAAFGDPQLSKIGKIAENYIKSYNIKFNNMIIDEYIIMPNHIHIIMRLTGLPMSPTPTIGQIVNNYKSLVTKQVGYSIWQRNYYEHIIRNEKEYLEIKKYIINNPINWEKDKYFNI